MRYQDFTLAPDPTRPTFSLDPSLVGLNALSAFDFTTFIGRPGGVDAVVTPVTGTQMANYVDGAATAQALTDLGYANKSLVFDSTDSLSLGLNFCLPASCTDYIVGYWWKGTAIGANGFANRVLSIRQGSTPTEVFWMVPTYTSGVLTVLEARTLNNSVSRTVDAAIRAAHVDNALHYIAFHMQSDGADQRVRQFLDGQLIVERPYFTRNAIPAPVAGSAGNFGKGVATNGVTGNLARAHLIDLTGYTARTAESIIYQQYDHHIERLTAAIA